MDIITPRLTLRPFDMADAPALQAILGDAETMTCLEPPYARRKPRRSCGTSASGERVRWRRRCGRRAA